MGWGKINTATLKVYICFANDFLFSMGNAGWMTIGDSVQISFIVVSDPSDKSMIEKWKCEFSPIVCFSRGGYQILMREIHTHVLKGK